MKHIVSVAFCLFAVGCFAQEKTPPQGVLEKAAAHKLVPANFFYAGQTAPVQTRNSGAVRSSGKLVLAGLVDVSGYSSSIAEKYQGFLITDGKVRIGGKDLAPGAYGIGSLESGEFIVTDLGANTVLTAPIQTDSSLKRPTPLNFAGAEGKYRLYLGRRFVTIEFVQSGK